MSDAAQALQVNERISDEKYRRGTEIERTSKVYTRRLVPTGAPLDVLDIGCGTGLNATHLTAMGHRVSGVDISQEAISKFEQAGFSGKKADIQTGLPFDDRSFDVVFASEVIEHVADTEFFLREARRVLRDRGTIILSTPNSSFWVYRLFAAAGKTLSEVQHPGHLRFFSKKSIRRAAEDAGFDDVAVAGRHMYLIVDEKFSFLGGPLKLIGAKTETRFKTRTQYWHVSGFAPSANGFWADTLILSARKK